MTGRQRDPQRGKHVHVESCAVPQRGRDRGGRGARRPPCPPAEPRGPGSPPLEDVRPRGPAGAPPEAREGRRRRAGAGCGQLGTSRPAPPELSLVGNVTRAQCHLAEVGGTAVPSEDRMSHGGTNLRSRPPRHPALGSLRGLIFPRTCGRPSSSKADGLSVALTPARFNAL